MIAQIPLAPIFVPLSFSAKRSPLLASASGLSGALMAWAVVCIYAAGGVPEVIQNAVLLVVTPASVTIFEGSYVMRSLRLLAMYDPVKRRRWGRFLKEKNTLCALLLPTGVCEVAAWSMVPAFGVAR